MAKTDRLYTIDRLIRQRGHLSFQQLLDVLEVSPATLKRDLEYLRDRLGAPIEYDRELKAYRFGAAHRGLDRVEVRHELPGLWFNERELYSLLTAHQLLSELDAEGVFARHLQPLLERIGQLLGGATGATPTTGAAGADTQADVAALVSRVKIISPAKRPVPGPFFERVVEALMQRRQLAMRYLTRGRRAWSERTVSPQRLVHHRATWYLDAWCHTRERLLRFALDAMDAVQVLEAAARELPLEQVRAEMDAGYGIFAGGERQWALLRFAPQAAQWASREQWHAEQQGRWLTDGSYELRVPYVDETELAMDVLRQGPEVRVLEPASLRENVRQRHAEAAALYARAPDATSPLQERT